MASSDRTPLGFRRTDPDETEGRLIYRQRANAEARMSLNLARRVRLKAPAEAE